MKKPKLPTASTPRLTGLCAVFLVLSTATVHAQSLSDHFNDPELNAAIWATNMTNGNGSVTLESSVATLDVGNGALTSGNRTTMISHASNLNPFANEIVVTISGLTISHTPADPTNPGWGNAFYAAIGRANGDVGDPDAAASNYGNIGGTYMGALGITLRQAESAFHLQVVDRGDGNHTTASFTLSNAPTDVIWTIDGTGVNRTWSIELVGAEFTNSSLATANGTFHRFTESELDIGDSTLVSRLAFGAINFGTVGEPTVASLDAISAVPEPAGFGLVFGAAVLALTFFQRRPTR